MIYFVSKSKIIEMFVFLLSQRAMLSEVEVGWIVRTDAGESIL